MISWRLDEAKAEGQLERQPLLVVSICGSPVRIKNYDFIGTTDYM
jgi:hypothetical protein